MPSLDFPPPQDSTVLPLRAAINHSHKPAQSGLRISWQDPRAMEGAAAVEGGERSNICLRPILSFLPPITTSNLCFSLRFHRIFPYQLQTRGGEEMEEEEKAKETKRNGSCIRPCDCFSGLLFRSLFFLFMSIFVIICPPWPKWIMRREKTSIFQPLLLLSILSSGHRAASREGAGVEDRRKYPA